MRLGRREPEPEINLGPPGPDKGGVIRKRINLLEPLPNPTTRLAATLTAAVRAGARPADERPVEKGPAAEGERPPTRAERELLELARRISAQVEVLDRGLEGRLQAAVARLAETVRGVVAAEIRRPR